MPEMVVYGANGGTTAPAFIHPQVLTALPNRWSTWTEGRDPKRPGRVLKIPQRCGTLYSGSAADRSHWGSYEQAADALRRYEESVAGLAFLVTGLRDQWPGLTIVVIDLDDCISFSGKMEDWARDILESISTWWEVSPSGRGLRGAFGVKSDLGWKDVMLKLPEFSTPDNPSPGIEIYIGGPGSNRYVSITGNHVPGTSVDLKLVDKEVAQSFYESFSKSKVSTDYEATPLPEMLDESECLKLGQLALSPGQLNALTRGEWLKDGKPTDRSSMMAGIGYRLLELGHSPQMVWSTLCHNPACVGVAEDHWGDRWKEYIWAWSVDRPNTRIHESLDSMFSSVPRSAIQAQATPPFEKEVNSPKPPIVEYEFIPPPAQPETIYDKILGAARGLIPGQTEELDTVIRAVLESSVTATQWDTIRSTIVDKKVVTPRALDARKKELTRERRNALKIDRSTGTVELPALPKEIVDKETLINGTVYCADTNCFINRLTQDALIPDAFKNNFMHLWDPADDGKTFNSVNYVSSNVGLAKVAKQSYSPGEGEIFTLPESGSAAYNTWRRSETPYPVQEVKEGDIEPWMHLTSWLIPDDEQRNHFIRWQACVIQYPPIKINYAIMLGGQHRIGKDSMLYPLREGVGTRNVKEAPGQFLTEVYQDYLVGAKLLIVEELPHAKSVTSVIEDSLKTVLAAPPYEILLRRFQAKPVTVPNKVSVVMMTNRRTALDITELSERVMCIWCDPIRPQPGDYYTKLYDWMRYPGASGYTGSQMVVGWLRQQDLTGFKPEAVAPQTPWAGELGADAQTSLAVEIQSILDDYSVPAVILADLQRGLKERGIVVPIQRISRVMRDELSYVRLRKTYIDEDGVHGKAITMWVLSENVDVFQRWMEKEGTCRFATKIKEQSAMLGTRVI